MTSIPCPAHLEFSKLGLSGEVAHLAGDLNGELFPEARHPSATLLKRDLNRGMGLSGFNHLDPTFGFFWASLKTIRKRDRFSKKTNPDPPTLLLRNTPYMKGRLTGFDCVSK